MAAPTIYLSDDASAPVISGTAGALVDALSAILVDGYGSKSPAGWTKEYTATNKAVFRMGGAGNRHYLRVDDTNAQMARIVAYTAMTDLDTGTNMWPSSGWISGGYYCRKSTSATATARGWICYASATQFLLVVCGDNSSATASTGADAMLLFGAIESRVPGDEYNTLLCGATDSSTSATAATATRQPLPYFDSTFSVNKLMAGDYGQTPAGGQACLSCASSPWRMMSISGDVTYGSANPDPATLGLNFAPIGILEGGYVLRGWLRGIYALLHSHASVLNRATLEGRGALSDKTFQILRIGNNSAVVIETSGGW